MQADKNGSINDMQLLPQWLHGASGKSRNLADGSRDNSTTSDDDGEISDSVAGEADKPSDGGDAEKTRRGGS